MKNAIRKLLALTLSLLMVLCMTVTASAAGEAASVSINGVELNDANPYWANGAATSTDLSHTESYAYFADGVLTLHNATIDFVRADGIKAEGDLTIKLSGENKVKTGGGTANAINVEGKLIIDGDAAASLTAIGGLTGNYGDGIRAYGDLTIKNVTIPSALGGNNGIESQEGVLTIENATITEAKGGYIGIYAKRGMTISGSTVTAEHDSTSSWSGDGIRCPNGDVSILNSTVTATGSGEYSNGINANGTVTITNSTVTAEGDTSAMNKEPALDQRYLWTTAENGPMTKSTAEPYLYSGEHTYFKCEPDPSSIGGNSGGGFPAGGATSTKVDSPDTFDGGVGLYVGMTLLATTGSAWLMKKKD